MAEMTAEMEALKSRLKATWMAGDYGYFATLMEPGALEFFDRLNVQPGTKMLDVACGSGQISIPAARAGAKVTGVDIATNLIEQARARAAAENLNIQFEEGDAEDLPFGDSEFDLVVSHIGAMFAPRPDLVASELLRVCRSGGRIVMANWTPEGHIGQMFRVIGKHVPPPPLMVSPVKWGDETTVRERLGSGSERIDTVRRMFPFRYPFSPSDVVEFYFQYYGPTARALAALDDSGKAALREDLIELWTRNNHAEGNSTHVDAEFLEVTAIKN